jgi:hypothetical protein
MSNINHRLQKYEKENARKARRMAKAEKKLARAVGTNVSPEKREAHLGHESQIDPTAAPG